MKYCLVHGDVTDAHIFIKNTKFNGLIDFGDSAFGPKCLDFKDQYKIRNTYKFEELEKGYGKKINLKRVEFIKFKNYVNCLPQTYYRGDRKSVV